MSRHVSTFATPYDADRTTPTGRPVAVKVIAVIVDGDDPTTAASTGTSTPLSGVMYLVVDHDHRTAIVPAGDLVFTDASVQPPRYG